MGRRYLLGEENATPDIATVMTRLARGEMEALTELCALAEGPVRSLVLRSFRGNNIWVDQDRLHDIVLDAILVLADLAPSWRSDGGAKPWRWAAPKIIAGAYRALGQFSDDIDDHFELESRTTAHGVFHREQVAVLLDLADDNAPLALLAEALGQVASERDREIWLAAHVEERNGNRAPAVTVAQDHGLTTANVRKIRQRVQTKLLRLANVDPRFAGLFALEPLVAA